MAEEELKKEKLDVPEKEVKLDVEKGVITDIPVAEEKKKEEKKIEVRGDIEAWKPRTVIGKKVKSGELKDIDEVLDHGLNLFEAEIIDSLLPGIETDLLLIGQAKGKFGGGQRRVFRQTQKKTPEGNNPSFCCLAVIGDKDGHVGVGRGKSKDTVPAREKAIRNAKLNIMKIRRGCGSWECGCKTAHSIPLAIDGKCGSVRIRLLPAPKGKGLIVEPECAKILKMAGISDIWSKTFGQTKVKINLIAACIDALTNLNKVKISPKMAENVGMIEGGVKNE